MNPWVLQRVNEKPPNLQTSCLQITNQSKAYLLGQFERKPKQTPTRRRQERIPPPFLLPPTLRFSAWRDWLNRLSKMVGTCMCLLLVSLCPLGFPFNQAEQSTHPQEPPISVGPRTRGQALSFCSGCPTGALRQGTVHPSVAFGFLETRSRSFGCRPLHFQHPTAMQVVLFSLVPIKQISFWERLLATPP